MCAFTKRKQTNKRNTIRYNKLQQSKSLSEGVRISPFFGDVSEVLCCFSMFFFKLVLDLIMAFTDRESRYGAIDKCILNALTGHNISQLLACFCINIHIASQIM